MSVIHRKHGCIFVRLFQLIVESCPVDSCSVKWLAKTNVKWFAKPKECTHSYSGLRYAFFLNVFIS